MMSFPDELVPSEVKIEIDIAEEPELVWTIQEQCSEQGIQGDTYDIHNAERYEVNQEEGCLADEHKKDCGPEVTIRGDMERPNLFEAFLTTQGCEDQAESPQAGGSASTSFPEPPVSGSDDTSDEEPAPPADGDAPDESEEEREEEEIAGTANQTQACREQGAGSSPVQKMSSLYQRQDSFNTKQHTEDLNSRTAAKAKTKNHTTLAAKSASNQAGSSRERPISGGAGDSSLSFPTREGQVCGHSMGASSGPLPLGSHLSSRKRTYDELLRLEIIKGGYDIEQIESDRVDEAEKKKHRQIALQRERLELKQQKAVMNLQIEREMVALEREKLQLELQKLQVEREKLELDKLPKLEEDKLQVERKKLEVLKLQVEQEKLELQQTRIALEAKRDGDLWTFELIERGSQK